jgi:hypothetical protein
MKKKRAILVLVCALCMPLPSAAAGMDDMFGVMFRMMLVMMNVMSNTMLNNSSDFGSGSPLGFGMGSWPAMGAMSGMNPTSSISGVPGMSAWSGMSSMPGMSPWSGMGGIPGNGMGMSPWSSPMSNNSWANPFTSGYPSYSNEPYNAAGYSGEQYRPVSLLEGRWFGSAGEVLEVRADRFQLRQGQYSISGAIKIENNIVNLYSPKTGTVMQYSFVRNQSELMLQDVSGEVLNFSNRSVGGGGYVF